MKNNLSTSVIITTAVGESFTLTFPDKTFDQVQSMMFNIIQGQGKYLTVNTFVDKELLNRKITQKTFLTKEVLKNSIITIEEFIESV